MAKNGKQNRDDLLESLRQDNPYKPGTLVAPRLGYFQPDLTPNKINKEILSDREHPCGIILGSHVSDNTYVNKEFYRVRFGNTTYERVHPVQMEIINEV